MKIYYLNAPRTAVMTRDGEPNYYTRNTFEAAKIALLDYLENELETHELWVRQTKAKIQEARNQTVAKVDN